MPASEFMTLKHLKSLREANRDAQRETDASDAPFDDDSQPDFTGDTPAKTNAPRSKSGSSSKSGSKSSSKSSSSKTNTARASSASAAKTPANSPARSASSPVAPKPVAPKSAASETPAAIVDTPVAEKKATRGRKKQTSDEAAVTPAATDAGSAVESTANAAAPVEVVADTASAAAPKAPAARKGRKPKATTSAPTAESGDPAAQPVQPVSPSPAALTVPALTVPALTVPALPPASATATPPAPSLPAHAPAREPESLAGEGRPAAQPDAPETQTTATAPTTAAQPTAQSTSQSAARSSSERPPLSEKAAPADRSTSNGRRRRGGRGGQNRSARQGGQTSPGNPGAQNSPVNQTVRVSAIAPSTQPPQPLAAPQQARGGTPAQGKSTQRRWFTVDLHMHTPASSDYEDPRISYLDWLRVVAERGLEIVAITDHNTVAGIAAIRREIEWLARLEQQNRLTDTERAALIAWRDLSNKVLVLPGFEFTATFGFHILGIFPPETSVRTLEHTLLSLKIPAEKLDVGSTETGASTDVLTAYRVIREAGGLAIAAHANSTHGVAMRNFPFGGQTKIAYTQDAYLDALEVTDLEQRGHSTARFFNGSKTEYPRRMHCIQGSDSHRLNADPRNPRRLGIGERSTEMLLDTPSFETIAALLRSTSFDRTRPAQPKDKPFDPLTAARAEGASIVQSFHDSAARAGGHLEAVLADICAFSNTAGGTIYVGASPRSERASGVNRPQQALDQILEAIDERLTPPIEVRGDVVKSGGATVIRLRVPKGDDRPYCVDDQKFFVRGEAETNLAVRDEIIAMVLDGMNLRSVEVAPGPDLAPTAIAPDIDPGHGNSAASATVAPGAVVQPQTKSRRGRGEKTSAPSPSSTPPAISLTDSAGMLQGAVGPDDAFYLPQIGVEIVESEQRSGAWYHSIRDLRNGNVIRNVTRRGARDLWNYAIRMHEEKAFAAAEIEWNGDCGLVHVEKRAGKVRYDLALRENDNVRLFYGVTEDGMEGPWADFVQDDLD